LTAALNLLEQNGTTSGISQIYSGATLTQMYNAPGIPTNPGPLPVAAPPTSGPDSRTPDIIVQPNVGVIYTGSKKKQAEHGGFAQDDTNVMILVSKPSFAPQTITSFVETMQVAPTILKALGLDPNSLQAVKAEGTQVLPGLPLQ
jgi:hypothetical protein